jgi:hypothetical protein
MAKTTAKNEAAATKTDAKPGDPAVAAKRERPKLSWYPGLKPEKDEKGKTHATVKLDEWPSDFDATKHRKLRRSDFSNEAVFLEHKADELEARAKMFRAEAETARKLGSAEDRARAKRLKTMLEKMEELKAQLSEQMGEDAVNEMIAKVQEAHTAPAEG